MAKTSAKKNGNGNYPARPETKKITQERIAGFWNPEAGPLAGHVLKKVEGDNPYYLFRAWDEVPCTDREEGEIVATRGMLVGCSGAAGLHDLDKNLGHFVTVKRGKKKVTNPKNGREFWPFEVEVATNVPEPTAFVPDEEAAPF